MIQRRKYLPRSTKPIARRTSPKRSWLKHGTKPIPKVNATAKAKRDARYRKVISSPRWKALRLKVWERTIAEHISTIPIHRCENCGRRLASISEMQLAHLSYARFGKELESDVQGQCKQCNQTEAALRGKRIRRTA